MKKFWHNAYLRLRSGILLIEANSNCGWVSLKISPRLVKILSAAHGISLESTGGLIDKIYRRVSDANKPRPENEASVYHIMPNVVAEMERIGVADDKINLYRLWAFAPTLFWFAAHNKEDYDDALISELKAVMNQAHNEGKFSYRSFCLFKHGLNIMQAYLERGELQMSDIPHREEHILGEPFICLLNSYRDRCGDYLTLSENTMNSRLSAILMFLYFLETARNNDG